MMKTSPFEIDMKAIIALTLFFAVIWFLVIYAPRKVREAAQQVLDADRDDWA